MKQKNFTIHIGIEMVTTFLLRVADQVMFCAEWDYKKEFTILYLGAWQPNVNDIDLRLKLEKLKNSRN